MNPDVTAYIAALNQPWQADLCAALRHTIHAALPDVEERLLYRKPHFLRNGAYIAVVSAANAFVSVTIFNATTLEAPAGVFEPGGTPDRKTIKIREGQALDPVLVATLFQQAARA